MIIDKLDCGKILISLCSNDINELSLTLGKNDISDIYTEQVLCKIIRFACSKTGVQIQNRPLTIEALVHNNGCLLLVTVTAERKKRVTYRIKKKKDCICYIFSTADAFLCAYEYLKEHGKILRHCKILTPNDKTYIIVCCGFSMPDNIDRFMCEYGVKKRKSPLFLAILNEKILSD